MGCTSLGANIQEQDILDIHNRKRALHNSPPLKLNSDLNELAKKSANKISKNKTFTKNIYNGEYLGENIFIYKGLILEPENICNEWYDEIKNYDKSLNKYQKNTGHFTQMIWKETKEIGFGYTNNDGIYYAVVYYYPAGNTLGEFKDNILIK